MMKCVLLIVALCLVFNAATAAPGKDCVPAATNLDELVATIKNVDVVTDVCPAEGKTGIAMTIGTQSHVDNAYATLSALRNQQKSTMPVTIFYMDGEVAEDVADMFTEAFVNIQFVNMASLPSTPLCDEEAPAGFAIKALALYHAKEYYQHVMWMDVDSLPLTTPESLFASEAYTTKGNMFWPDFYNGWVNEAIYDALTNVKPSKVADTESGQLLIDTCKHADVLQFVHALNQQSAVTYDYMFGDKDTFRLAFAIADKLEAFNQLAAMPGAAFASKASSDELQRIHDVNLMATEGGLDLFEQASARCEFMHPAFLVGMIQSAADAPAFFHRTNAEFSLRQTDQIGTEFVIAPRSSEEAKGSMWQVPYPSLAWAVCADQVTALQTPPVIHEAEAAATAALDELTEKIISGNADTYTEMTQGPQSEIVRVMSVLSQDELRRTGNTTSAPTSAPTAAVGSSVITQMITASYTVTADQWTVNGVDCDEKTLSECAYAKAIGVATFEASGCAYTDGATVSTTAAATRRANSLAVTYSATVSESQATSATTAAGTITATSFTAEMTSAKTTVDAFTSITVPTVATNGVAQPTVVVTTAVPTAAPTAAVVDSAPASAGLSFVSMAAVAIAVKQLL